MLNRLSLINFKHKYHTKNWIMLHELVLRKNTENLNYWETSLGTAYLYQEQMLRCMNMRIANLFKAILGG